MPLNGTVQEVLQFFFLNFLEREAMCSFARMFYLKAQLRTGFLNIIILWTPSVVW